MKDRRIDIIAFGAHPDDVELSCGGTLISLVEKGYKVGIVDLTQGELSTRGNLKKRKEETENATKILGVHWRENLKFKDGNIKVEEKSIKKVVEVLRKYKPKIVFAPYFNDRHPDHKNAALLIKESSFFSGLVNFKIEKDYAPYRPKKIFYYMQSYPFEPSFICDISQYFELKMEAVLAYSSQFYNPNSKEPETFISRPEFLNYLKARAEFYGFQIGKQYGEPFYSEEKIEFDFSPYLD